MQRFKNIFLNSAFFLNVLLVFFLIFEKNLQHLPKWMQVAGRLHPMILHFPIALLIVSLLLEWAGRKNPQDGGWKEKMEFMLAFTAFSASASALFGLLLYHTGEYENGRTIQLHKWLGIAIALLTGILVWLRKQKKIFYYFALVSGVIITIIAGHFGASVTHGENFLSQPLQIKKPRIKDIDQAMVFADLIQPIFNEKCIGCHNPDKSKGELLLVSKEKILEGGKDGPVIIAGNADTSLLYANLLLPLTDEKHMPPEGKPQLDPEEIKLFRWWINSGAVFEKNLASLNPPDSIHSMIQARYGVSSPLDELKIPFASQETIRSLNNQKRDIHQVSLDQPYIDVFEANRKDMPGNELEELAPVSQQVVSIDLSNSKITDRHLEPISTFPHLRKLYLENTDVTDAGIRQLKDLKFLEYLNISNTHVSEKILDDLKKIKSLKRVYFYETNIPVANIRLFQTSKPGIKVGFTPDLSADTSFRGRLTEPTVKVDSNIFINYATIEMNYRLKGVTLHYSTNGKDPDSTYPLYLKPLQIDSTCELKVIATREGWQSSDMQTFFFLRARYRFTGVQLSKQPDKRFMAKKDSTLIDLEKGSDDQGDGKYIGYEGEDVSVQLDLGTSRRLSSLAISYLVNHGGFILAPEKAEVWGTDDKNKPFKKISEKTIMESRFKPGSSQGSLICRIPAQSLRYLKVRVTNKKILPRWHPNAGKKSWILLDEILAN